MRKISTTFTASVLLALLVCCVAEAQSVGRFAVVQNEVTSLRPGAEQAVPAVMGGEIVLDELETTGRASAAKMTFGEGAVISIGQQTEFRVTGVAVKKATGESVSTIDMLVGKMRVFVSRFWGGRPEVEVQTPTAVVGIKGSEVVIEVLPDGTTRVTVLTGDATVRRLAATTTEVDLTVARRVEVVPGAEIGPVQTAPPAELDDLWQQTEPDPSAPPPPPTDPPTGDVRTLASRLGNKKMDSAFATNTAAVSSANPLVGFPQSTLSPEAIPRDQRSQQPPDPDRN